MLYNWVVMFDELVEIDRRRAGPLDDPLDRPEWRGLSWPRSGGRRAGPPRSGVPTRAR